MLDPLYTARAFILRVHSSILFRNEPEIGNRISRSWCIPDFLNRTSRVYFCQIFNRFSIHPNSRETENFFLFRARKLALHSTVRSAGCQLVAIFACFIHEIRSCLSYSQIRFSECRRGISSPETCRSTIEKRGITKIKKKKKSVISFQIIFYSMSRFIDALSTDSIEYISPGIIKAATHL